MKTLTIIFSALALTSTAFAKTYELKLTGKGFEPSSIQAKKNEDVTLKITRVTDSTCATKVQVPSRKISKDLPLNESVEVKLGKVTEGKVKFGCGMGMMVGGVVIAESSKPPSNVRSKP